MQSPLPSEPITRQIVPRSRLMQWLDLDVPLTILHGPAGAGKTELLAQWMTAHSDRSYVHLTAPLTVQQLSSALPPVRNSTEAGDKQLIIVIDNIDTCLPPEAERLLFTSLARHSALRIVASGRSTRGLEERAQRARTRSTIRFGEDLAATTTEVAGMLEARDGEAKPRRIRDLIELTNGWMEPVRLVLEESHEGSLDPRAAERWVANVALDGLTDNDRSFLARLSLLERIDSDTVALVAATATSALFQPDRVASLQDRGLVRREGTSWAVVPIVRSVMEARMAATPATETQALHAAIAHDAYTTGPVRFGREILRHARRGHAWKLLERFWREHGAAVISEHPQETSSAFTGLPDEVVNNSTTLAVAAALSSSIGPDSDVLGRLAKYSDQQSELPHSQRKSSTDSFIEDTVIRILQLRRRGRFAEAHAVSNQVERELRRLVETGAERPTAANAALLLIQHAVNRLLARNDSASAAELARNALTFARASKLEALTSEVLGFLAMLRAANGWSAPVRMSTTARVPSSARDSDSFAPTHTVAKAMAAVDSLDRERSSFAVNQAQLQTSSHDIWPLTALAEGRHALFFETSDVLDDHYRHLVWSHPSARDELGTGRIILDWTGVLADLRAGRLAEAERRIAESKDESSWMSVLTARLHLSNLEYEKVLQVTDSAVSRDGIGNRERSQFMFMGAAGSLMLGKEREASVLFRQARALADKHGLRSTYLAISRDQRAELVSLDGLELTGGVAARLDAVPDAFPERAPQVTLSARESEVLHGISIAASHREIATALYISVPTVRSHVRTLYGKLAVSDSAAAVGRASELGLLRPTWQTTMLAGE